MVRTCAHGEKRAIVSDHRAARQQTRSNDQARDFELREQICPRRDCAFMARAVADRDPPLAPILKWRDDTG
ncbi:MAG: hypothetical protein AAGL66_18555, partial [Pseudomonadota bacterium]